MLLQLFDPLPGSLKLSLQSGNKIDQPTSVDSARVDILFELFKAIHDPSVTNPTNSGNARFRESTATGQRLEVGVGGGRKRLNILGAFCPDDHEYLDRRYTDKNLTARSVIELFERMMELHPQTKHFRIYLDNARYQHAKVLKAWIEQTRKDKGVTFDLKHLPAYSPNLNLIERLWKFLRKEALQRWHESFEDMQKAVARVLDNLGAYKEQLRTLMTERFHLTPDRSTLEIVQAHS